MKKIYSITSILLILSTLICITPCDSCYLITSSISAYNSNAATMHDDRSHVEKSKN